MIELWLAGADGEYDDAHRATIIAEASGAYRFESNVPPPYYGRPPHIHLRISAKGFKTLVTQHYPSEGKKNAVFDIVLVLAKH
jgi:protocatechuate 3,4-dioxygenase beta subunit